MTESMQTLVAKPQRCICGASDRCFCFQLCLTGVLIGLRIDVIAAEKAFHRSMVTTGMAGLVAGRKRVVDIALEPKRLPTDSMDDGMTVAPQLRVFRFKTLNHLEHVGGWVVLKGLPKKIIEALSTAGFFQTFLHRRQRG